MTRKPHIIYYARLPQTFIVLEKKDSLIDVCCGDIAYTCMNENNNIEREKKNIWNRNSDYTMNLRPLYISHPNWILQSNLTLPLFICHFHRIYFFSFLRVFHQCHSYDNFISIQQTDWLTVYNKT